MFNRKSNETAATGQLRAGDYAVELLGVEDPYLTSIWSPHSSAEYDAGLERLVAFDLRVRNLSRSKDQSVCVGWFRVQDTEGYDHKCLSLDLRVKKPALLEGPVAPDACTRGWLTFALPRDRQPQRLVFFSGYLMGKTITFELPCRTVEEWEAHYDEAKRAFADRQIAHELAVRDAQLREQEVRAAALAGHVERVRELEQREAAIEGKTNGGGRSAGDLEIV